MEAELIAWLRQRLPTHPRLLLGPGDDAALLALGQRPDCLITVDLLSEGVDFSISEIDPRRVGRKALAVNLSDMAAMAARPLGAVVALLLPRNGGFELARQLYEGLLPLAHEFDTPIAGGDINSWEGPLVLSITLIGQAGERGPLLRSGARPGDMVVVTGQFGGSRTGHQFDFTPRVAEALWLHEQYTLHAGMDVSDGLTLDLSRLCQESGCGAVLDLDQVPIAAAAVELAALDGQSALHHALGDGEDFELILAMPPAEAQRLCREQPLETPVTTIGQFAAERGLWQSSATAPLRQPLAVRGYKH